MQMGSTRPLVMIAGPGEMASEMVLVDHVDRPIGRGVGVVMLTVMIMTPLSPAGRPARERPEGRVCAHGESTQPP